MVEERHEDNKAQHESGPDIDRRTGKPIKEAEDELSRYETADSAPEPTPEGYARVTNKPAS